MEPDSIDKSTIVITPSQEGTAFATENREETTLPESTASTSLPSTTPVPTDDLDDHESPKITHALEALLGGLTPPPMPSGAAFADGSDPLTTSSATAKSLPELLHTMTEKDTRPAENTALAAKSPPAVEPTDTEMVEVTGVAKVRAEDTIPAIPQNSNPLLSADVEMTQGGLEETDHEVLADDRSVHRDAVVTESAENQMDTEVTGEQHPEWEADSSPIESSSDDSSDDSSSEDSEEGDDPYQLLTPEEQARILMAGDGGSDDENTSKSKGTGSQLRTKNEVPEVVIPKPDVQITVDMPLVELGAVETIVDNIALIKGKTSGEYRVLESGSVLCLEDRSVVGAVAEPLGRVQQPLYSVLFTNAASVAEAGLSVGKKIFYTEQHATFVFTQALKAFKGSDASNLHDEEVGDEEMEFSDDEAELEHKRRVKQKKNEKMGLKSGNRMGRGQTSQQRSDPVADISYDDTEDGPYKPLARPVGLAYSIGHGEAPQEGSYSGQGVSREPFRDRGRGGDRGRGRAARGRGRGAQQNRGGSNGYSQRPQNPPSQQDNRAPAFPHQFSQGSHVPQSQAPQNFYNVPQQYSPNQSQMPAWPPFLPQPPFPQHQLHQQHQQQQQQQPQQQPYQQAGFQQTYQNMHQMQGTWPPMPPMPPGPTNPSGAFINPSFFGNAPSGMNQQPHHEGRRDREGQ